MGKIELVNEMANVGGMTKKNAKLALDAFESVVAETLAKGEKVSINGFGTFSSKERPARVAYNPKNREPVNVPAKRVGSFKFSPKVKEMVV